MSSTCTPSPAAIFENLWSISMLSDLNRRVTLSPVSFKSGRSRAHPATMISGKVVIDASERVLDIKALHLEYWGYILSLELR